ncbi:L,D-transpeptidase family protein [Magnetospirillum sulfuroxidans]|uniref:L,D-transpeptidase family protein n=1 Tax=Magnetospirillum sulfuroxidans TaxID=611300 RepID=A0ABS5IG79_9PROT|nr:L,D-transpeptidase family protein [Magnetospirillum sulfuroxidans]MBR9972758.1 L,D-transpeptidase family protein [Magnetospirillum sulfuroxidans]
MDIQVDADGHLHAGGLKLKCRLGRAGLSQDKREGDGATPIGAWPLRVVLYRPDRVSRPDTALAVRAIDADDGWCDDPTHADYNRPVRLPHPGSCEKMWRDDHLYDVVVVLGHNDSPPLPGLGSAIFLHVADPDGKPTQGCVALALGDLLELLKSCRPGDRLVVVAPPEQG